MQKARKSAGRVSLAGVDKLFLTPPQTSPPSRLETPSLSGTPESVLYADIPDTPNGPGEMLVSPLSSAKSSGKKSRNGAGLVGVKELFKEKLSKSQGSPGGIKRLLKTPKVKKSHAVSPSPSGLKRLMKTPRSQVEPASPSGVASLFASPVVEVHFTYNHQYFSFFMENH